jgi:hypothetical protein
VSKQYLIIILYLCSWNGTSSTDFKIRIEMFSSYVVSSLDAEDNSSEIGLKKLPNGEVVVDIAQVDRIR